MRLGGINQKALLSGALAGAVTPYAARVLGPYGPGLAAVAVGMFQRDAALQTLGSYSLGAAIVGQMPGTASGGAGWL